jgi:arylsulfatase A-like enzyme
MRDCRAIASRPPNIVLLITDQQRYPRHWPGDPGWQRELMPNDAELARTGLSFERAFCSTSMCSPSRATLFTGLYPSEHGVELTLTAADLKPDPRNAPSVAGKALEIARRPGAPREMVLRGFLRGLFQLGPKAGGEPELPPELPNLATILGDAGYTVAYKGKWHLTHPSGAATGKGLLGGWTGRDSERIEREYGFADWEAPDAGENTKAENFGGGNAGPDGQGWDEEYTRQVEEWLGRERLPEPFCLVISLVNPHDVLGYPAQMRIGGYRKEEFADLEVGLPPTLDEQLLDKPRVHTLMQMGMNAYLGPLRSREAQLEYVNFYAHLHRVIDRKLGRVLAALGDASDPHSLRSRTLVVRTSDHGEMGLSHGGLRQKAFNVYEETIHVPLVISNPVLYPEPARTEAPSSLIDVLPTLVSVAGNGDGAAVSMRGRDLTPVLAQHASPKRGALRRVGANLDAIAKHPQPAPSVQDQVHFTYDDHQAGTALQEAPGQPNRIRCVRTASAKYALYFDPAGKAPNEHELYDLERDPDERRNLLDRDDGEARDAADRALRDEMRERLEAAMNAGGTAPGA